jgi:UDPglucose--hexose-1-phosphate uridylyltransferase
MMKKCYLTGEFVFYATDRAKRPHSYKQTNVHITPKQYCPFCPENESHVPKVLYRSEDNEIRIIKNKYPFIAEDDDCFGVHDVLIDTSDHDERMSQFTDEHMHDLMRAIQHRFNELFEDKRSAYVQVFKNQGMDAGASQSHSHWQITSLCVIPVKLEHILQVLKNYYYENGVCYFCNMKFGDRIVEENEDFIVYLPADGKFAYGMDILPKKHVSSISDFTDSELANLGKALRNAVKRLVSVTPGVCYNVCFYSAPKGYEYDKYFHFYVQIIPRIGHMAGFEFSTGCYINSVLPEDGAKTLREIEI